MMAVRWGLLLVAALALLGAIGATAAQMPPSAQRLTVSSVVGLLAPLFWPGSAATASGTVRRIAGWAVAGAGLAVMLLIGFGHPAQPTSEMLTATAMLTVIMLLSHLVVAALETRWRGRSGDAQAMNEKAGRTVAIALVALGSFPLWLGPAAEASLHRHPWIIDAIVGVSPLTHLAVASGNDLLRLQWLYQNSNLAALPTAYPSLPELAGAYAAIGLLLTLAVMVLRHRRRPLPVSRIPFDMEKT